MKKSKILIACFVVCIGLMLSLNFTIEPEQPFELTDSVSEVLSKLGKNDVTKYANTGDPNVSVEAGKNLIFNGFANSADGKKTRRQSKHFVCISCHNTEREDPDLTKSDPQARLDYVSSKGIPFLQGTTLYGVVNRDSFYNGDYVKKYGDLVNPARDNIREAIQLCATECAQGRPVKSWEMESILAYLWTIDLKMSDLNFAGEEIEYMQTSFKKASERDYMINLIEGKYSKASPATFNYPPEDRSEGYPYKGSYANGKKIYESSCLWCHEKQRFSYLHLDESKMSTNHLKRNLNGYRAHSIYQVVRWGVPTKYGKGSYMPHYPAEKLSDKMVEDLVAYVRER